MISENREKQTEKRKSPRSAWRPGESGNPGGRPKVAAEVRDLAREYGAKAIERLVALMHSKNESVAVRAVEAILDRAYGRPMQAMELTENNRNSINPQEPPCDFSKLTDEEWKTLLNARETMGQLLAKARGGGPSVRTV
jgi:hypothetical protein